MWEVEPPLRHKLEAKILVGIARRLCRRMRFFIFLAVISIIGIQTELAGMLLLVRPHGQRD